MTCQVVLANELAGWFAAMVPPRRVASHADDPAAGIAEFESTQPTGTSPESRSTVDPDASV